MDTELLTLLTVFPPTSFKIEDIDKVVLLTPGQINSNDWLWAVHLKQGRTLILAGGFLYNEYNGEERWDYNLTIWYVDSSLMESAFKETEC